MNFSPIPKAAPFAEEEIEILNRVVGPASPTQRAWLAGFLAGVDAATMAPQPAVSALPAEPLTILYAIESRNSERLASDMAKAARKMELKPSIVDMADLDVATLALVRRLVVIAATWGEGNPTVRAIRAYGELMGEGAPRLEGDEFSVLALGDTAYAEFCAIGQALDARLEVLGGKRVADRVDCDLDFAQPAGRWIEMALKALAPAEEDGRSRVIAVDFGAKAAGSADLGLVEAEITELINLNSSESEKETIRIELGFDGAAPPYKPGDSLAIYPENDAAYVDDLLKAAGLASATALRVEMINDRDITTLSLKPLQSYTAAPGHPQVKTLLDSGHARAWIAGRQLIDLLQAFPAALSADQLAGDTTAGAPRLLHRFLAPRRGGGGASTDLRSALPERRALEQGRCFRLRRRPVEERAAAAREVAAQPAFRAARAGPRHHHDRAGHRHCTLPRLRAGAPRHRRERPLLAILRRPPIQPRFSQSARIAG